MRIKNVATYVNANVNILIISSCTSYGEMKYYNLNSFSSFIFTNICFIYYRVSFPCNKQSHKEKICVWKIRFIAISHLEILSRIHVGFQLLFVSFDLIYCFWYNQWNKRLHSKYANITCHFTLTSYMSYKKAIGNRCFERQITQRKARKAVSRKYGNACERKHV